MTQQDIINARKGVKLRDLDPQSALVQITDIIADCHLIKGTKSQPADNVVTARIVYSRLMQESPGMTIKELDLACKEALFSGVKSYGVNPQDMITWVKNYGASEEYKFARQEEERILDASRMLETSPQDEEAAAKAMLRRDYDWYYQHASWYEDGRERIRMVTPRGTFCYDYLVRMGKLDRDAWKNFKGRRRNEMNLFERSISEHVDDTIARKAMAVTDYIERKATAARERMLNSIDLPV